MSYLSCIKASKHSYLDPREASRLKYKITQRVDIKCMKMYVGIQNDTKTHMGYDIIN